MPRRGKCRVPHPGSAGWRGDIGVVFVQGMQEREVRRESRSSQDVGDMATALRAEI
jgi:hypothetical protein